MEENERPEEVGELVTPAEEAPGHDGAPEEDKQTAQSREENRRFQAARRNGERTGYERAMRQVREQLAREEEDRAREQAFISRDADEFLRRFPAVDLAELDGDRAFRRFCGSRYGRESLGDLYEDYLALAGGLREAALARADSKAQRETGAGGGSGTATLTARQQKELDEWNRANPRMKMTAKEFMSR